MARSTGAEDWLSAHIPDQTGRTILITGANVGLGAPAPGSSWRAAVPHRPRRWPPKSVLPQRL